MQILNVDKDLQNFFTFKKCFIRKLGEIFFEQKNMTCELIQNDVKAMDKLDHMTDMVILLSVNFSKVNKNSKFYIIKRFNSDRSPHQ